MADEEEDFEVLDLSTAAYRRNRGYIQQLFGDISKQSAAKQVVIGGAAGCASGYLSVKVGKSAAITIGVTILLIRVLRLFVYKSWQNSCLQFRNHNTSHTDSPTSRVYTDQLVSCK
ncbi:uncharacterized protein LOC123554806 isoform X3 [Mercenaria mercenaria]|uniref:uncharacterized protein LOC123554806 isoform X3 n=1 Tax=Mercenaria mercenaria TaxID=6596 RepID=UPI001E1E1942|nr:uncharacterized protein LOC123554806 isoform X3 [Mercenaria mercenaria]